MSGPSSAASSTSTSVTLAVGARYACFYCRVRSQKDGRCERCGRTRFELVGNSANSRLVQLARRVFKATAVHGAQPERDRAMAVVSHVMGIATAALSTWLVLHHPGSTAGSKLWVILVAAVVGYAAGMLSIALFLLLIWLSIAFVALSISLAILPFSMLLTLASFALPSARGVAARASIVRGTERLIAKVFEPVFRLRGGARSQQWKQPRRHEGLRPARLALPEPKPGVALRFEGKIARCAEHVAIADVRAPIVGVAGYTVGARVEDALVAPFEIETAEGPVRVQVDVGEVIFVTAQRSERVLRELPTQWGIGRAKHRVEAMPPTEPVAVFSASLGASVLLEGGELSERAAVSDREGYRDSSFERSVRGTAAHPLRVTVLDRG